MPAIVDRAVREKITKGRAGIRLDNVVEKIWTELGGEREEKLSIEKFSRSKGKNRRKGEASAKK